MGLRALLVLCACVMPLAGQADVIKDARFSEPTDRYAHAILGDAIEYCALEVTLENGSTRLMRLPISRVFEDLAPRVQDLDGNGRPEVIVIETDVDRGASLAIYGPQGKITATPYIGRSNRWLAPIGAADFDGDGATEIGYIDRPHLAKELRLWRYKDRTLSAVAIETGLTNHRIGQDFITGGVRNCDGQNTMIVVDATWTRVIEVGYGPDGFSRQDRGPYQGTRSADAALAC